jgi:peptide/nickel transport system permease protein
VRRFLAARIAHAAIVVIMVTTIAFFLLRMAPGDPFSYEDPSVSPAIRAQWRAVFGYDRPVAEQFVRYVGNVARGNFGYSVINKRPVSELIGLAAPRTLSLAFVSLALAAIIGIGLGVVAAARHRTLPDRVISTLSVVVYSVPEFWLALIIQMTLGFGLGLFPISGFNDPLIADYGSAGEVFLDRLKHMVLPTLALTILLAVILARFQRAAMIDVLPSDYLRTARAKGAPEGRVLMRHALRNALTPTITMLGVLGPTVLGGIFFIEYVFDWHGLGWMAVNSVETRDYDLATATVVISGVLVALGSLAADLATAFSDPRIRDA